MRAGRTQSARTLRINATEAEKFLWSKMRGGQFGRSFRRQHPIPPYVVDFACIAARLVVEADGGQHNLPGEHEGATRSYEGRVGEFFDSGTTTFTKILMVSWRRSQKL